MNATHTCDHTHNGTAPGRITVFKTVEIWLWVDVKAKIRTAWAMWHFAMAKHYSESNQILVSYTFTLYWKGLYIKAVQNRNNSQNWNKAPTSEFPKWWVQKLSSIQPSDGRMFVATIWMHKRRVSHRKYCIRPYTRTCCCVIAIRTMNKLVRDISHLIGKMQSNVTRFKYHLVQIPA